MTNEQMIQRYLADTITIADRSERYVASKLASAVHLVAKEINMHDGLSVNDRVKIIEGLWLIATALVGNIKGAPEIHEHFKVLIGFVIDNQDA